MKRKDEKDIFFLKGNNPRRAGRRRKWKREWIVKIQSIKKKSPVPELTG